MARTYLKPEYEKRMQGLLGDEYPAFVSCMEMPAVKGLRVNTLRLSVNEFLRRCDFHVEQSEIVNEGFVITDDTEGIGNHYLHISGAMYLQEPSAMSVFSALPDMQGLRVLDLCAAPGGKTGGIAQKMCGSGILVSNEIEKPRAKELFSNVERLGIANSIVTCAHPEKIAAALPRYFDVVVVDAPCSGEGMIRKNHAAMQEWSEEHVTACANRQYSIMESAAKCTAEGGMIIYSTCTFESEENEQLLERFVREHEEYTIVRTERLYPHTCRGEGHFLGILQSNACKLRTELPEIKKNNCKPCKSSVFDSFIDSTFIRKPDALPYIDKDGNVFYATAEMTAIAALLPTLYFGICAGKLHDRYFEPAHSLFMAAHDVEYASTIDLCDSNESYAAFLRGEELSVDSIAGYARVCVHSLPIGFGKAVDGRLKNKLPKGLRRSI